MTDVESDETRMIRLEVERSIEFKARVTRLVSVRKLGGEGALLPNCRLDVSAIPISRENKGHLKF